MKVAPVLWIGGIMAVLFVANEMAKPPSAVGASISAPAYAPTTFGTADASTPDPGSTSTAEDRAAKAVSETTYAKRGSPHGCTQDCSGHDAGFEWAKNHNVTDETECGGNSASFREGCEAYAEAYQEALEDARMDRDGN